MFKIYMRIAVCVVVGMVMSLLFSFSQNPVLKYEGDIYELKAIDGSIYVPIETVAELLTADLHLINNEYIFYKDESNGKTSYADGGFYQGEQLDGLYHGKGYRMYSDGSYYDGEWLQGLYHGEGELRNAEGDIYNGSFENGFKMGAGTMYYKNSDVYIGEWSYNFRDGFGRLTYANTDKYVGYWKDGNFHGPGILFEGRFEKRGEWERGLFKRPLTKSETYFKDL